jgi:rhamnosyltransferase
MLANDHNPSVAVLLAACNGTRWIKEQVDTIFKQKDVEVDIYISVDLSSDGTYEWCKELEEKKIQVKVLPYGDFFGGAAKNFFRLIKDVDFSKYDYVSLADQDDIWLPLKLSRGIKFIKDRNLDGYSSNVIAFWKYGRKKNANKSYSQKQFDYYFEAAGAGCTYIFKQKSLQKFKVFLINNWTLVNEVVLHDWMIYAYFRSISMLWYIDKTSSMYYRQHNNNQIGVNSNLKAYISRLKKINNRWYSREVRKIISLLKPHAKETITLNRVFIIINFYKLRRRPRDAIVLLLMNILGLFI